jgi:hypothetical protein
VQVPRQLVLKEEDSPAKSPATTSNWNSPNQIPGVSPVGSSVTDEYAQAMQGQQVQHPTAYGVNPMQANIGYNTSPQMHLQARQQQSLPPGHRRRYEQPSEAPANVRSTIATADESYAATPTVMWTKHCPSSYILQAIIFDEQHGKCMRRLVLFTVRGAAGWIPIWLSKDVRL